MRIGFSRVNRPATDRTEMKDLASAQPQKVQELTDLWNQWAATNNVLPFDQLKK
jgi:hypothetical protein